MKKIYSTLLLLFMLTIGIAQVQIGKDKYGPSFFSTSPNASSLGTYGLIPLNLSTGTPIVNIDLLNFSTKDNNYNISLNYNLPSVKPETPVQWTGLGWNLNVGGAVTRNMNRFPDEYRGVLLNQTNYYDNYSKFDIDNWHTMSGDVIKDSPDTFMFEVNGINGKFYKNHKGKWIVTANQEVNFSIIDEMKYDYITYPNNNKDRCIYGFEITDSNGNTYIFGKNPSALEIVYSSVNSSNRKMGSTGSFERITICLQSIFICLWKPYKI